MTTLRHSRHLARLVLAWFVLALGVAVASPVVHPKAMALVCSSSGALKLLAPTQEGQPADTGHTLDCPLCAVSSPAAPPPVVSLTAEPASPRALVLEAMAPAHIASRAAAQFPPRGPPVFS